MDRQSVEQNQLQRDPLLVIYYNKECEQEVEDYIVHNSDKSFLIYGVIKFVMNNYIKRYCLSLFNQYVVQVNSFKECLDMFYPPQIQIQKPQNQMSFQFKDSTQREQPLHPTFSNNVGQDVLRYKD